jgi:hypothetical protein
MKSVHIFGFGLAISISTQVVAYNQDELQDNEAYAVMQQCLASAELPANLGTQLDRYCIDSYLATTTRYKSYHN